MPAAQSSLIYQVLSAEALFLLLFFCPPGSNQAEALFLETKGSKAEG
jgi:hypothetical protein